MDFIHQTNRIYAQDERGIVIAEVTFPAIGPDVVDVNHTFVDDSLRGQGVAAQLMQALILRLRESHKTARLSCTYAATYFSKHPEYSDLVN